MDLLTPTLPYIQWLQQFHFLLAPMKFFSFLGSTIFYLAMLPVIYWAVSRPVGARLGALLLFSSVVNEIFKVGFALPRPYWLEPALTLSREASFGFPSGHAQSAWLLWPFIALQMHNRRLWVPLSILMALGITISRNYLGVHFLADSIGGMLIGLCLLGLTIAAGPAWMRFWRQLSSFQKIVFSVFATLFLAGIYAIAMYRGAYSQLNGYGNVAGKDYETAIRNALSGGVIATRLGGFCGLLCGLALAARAPHFETRLPLKFLAPRLAFGFAGVALFYQASRFPSLGGIAWLFASYFAMNFWVICGAPWAFEKLFGNQKRRVV